MEKQYDDVSIYEAELRTEKGIPFKIAILRGGFRHINPGKYMDEVVYDYVKNNSYNEFVESHLDVPWVRVIVSEINELDYKPYSSQKVDKFNDEH